MQIAGTTMLNERSDILILNQPKVAETTKQFLNHSS